MLWVNLIMDTLASLALATEPPVPELLLRKPHSRKEYIITKKMFKHILGQAALQLIILIIVTLTGENWIPEYVDDMDDFLTAKIAAGATYKFDGGNRLYGWDLKYSDADKSLVRSGRYYQVSSAGEDYPTVFSAEHPSRHYTFIFTLFVCMQIVNFLNARKLKDELNVFDGIMKSHIFITIVIAIILLQAIITTHGSISFDCYNFTNSTGGGGLFIGQWLIAIGISLSSLIMSMLLKIAPFEEKLCP